MVQSYNEINQVILTDKNGNTVSVLKTKTMEGDVSFSVGFTDQNNKISKAISLTINQSIALRIALEKVMEMD